MLGKHYTLYIDETGVRYPDHTMSSRTDTMDWFALGGILLCSDDEESSVRLYREFCSRWNITYPLHSTEIRGARGKFGWLSDEARRAVFLHDLNDLLIHIPALGFAAVISRPGYNKRYKEKYGNGRWQLCKTAYPILVERVARHLQKIDPEATLKIVFEGASGAENRNIIGYAREMKQLGNPFDKANTSKYDPISPHLYSKVISGLPKPGTKDNIFLQIADLYVYPMVKRKYDNEYRGWTELYAAKRVIDATLLPEEFDTRGIKYSCFDS